MDSVTVLRHAVDYAVVETAAQDNVVVVAFNEYMLVEGHTSALFDLLTEDGQALLTEGGDALRTET